MNRDCDDDYDDDDSRVDGADDDGDDDGSCDVALIDIDTVMSIEEIGVV